MIPQTKSPQPTPTIDLRAITRYPKLCKTRVILYWDWNRENAFEWILAGQSQIMLSDRKNDNVSLDARMDATDREHDSAYAFKLPIIGLRLEHVWYHTSHFVAWVNPNEPEDFNVPDAGYNPTKDPNAYRCKECKGKEAHIIVPNFVPPSNLPLFELVKGKKIEIEIGPAYPKEEE
jgi:hypothetical protein